MRAQLCVKVAHNHDPFANNRTERSLGKALSKFTQCAHNSRAKHFLEWLIVDMVVIRGIWKPVFEKNADKYRAILQAWKIKGIG